MSGGTKRRIVVVGLVLFAMWPLVHRMLVLRYDISPWRFFGWAMYCQPKFPIEVEIYVQRGGAREPVTDTLRAAELQRQRVAYARRREMWGALLAPDDLAQATLEAIADAQAAEIVVRRLQLQASTAHIEAREQVYVYPRPGS